jgi:predicted Zn-dependent peptidase
MYKKSILPSGIRLIEVPNRNTQTVTVMALFGVGSRHEKGHAEGIAHFLEHMLFKGTDKRPTASDINKELDSVGASSNAFTGKEYTGFWAQTEKKDLPLALDIISDILLHSKFDEREIENEKGAIIEEINMYEDAPMRDIPSVLENMLYAGQSLGHDQLGSKENVRSFTRRDLLAFYRKHYTADNLIVAISGNFDASKIRAMVAQAFSQLPKAAKQIKPVKNYDRQTAPEVFIKYKKTDQTNFSLGFRALPIDHREQYALNVLDVILGGNCSSRLFENVREKAGLAYYIYSFGEDFHDVGYFTVQSGVGNDKLDEALAMVLEEVRQMKTELVGAAELARAKSYVKGRMAISLESSSSLANFVTSQEILTGKILTPQEKFAKIQAVTAADVQRVAGMILTPERMNLALIGPFKDKKRFQKLLTL